MALLHQWKCQDNAASTTVVATVGTNATLAGGDNTSAISVASGPGTALTRSLDFDGTADAVDVSGAAISFASGAAFTFAMWFNYDAATNYFLMGKSADSANYLRFFSSGGIRVRAAAANTDFSTAAFSTGTWYHLLFSRTTGNSARVFISGTESSSGALSIAAALALDRVAVGTSPAVYFDGRICDVRVYDSDESANVAAIMAEKDTAVIGPRVMHHRRMMGMG